MNEAFTMQQAIRKVIGREHLTKQEAKQVMFNIMDGHATPAQIGSLLTGLQMKGEVIEEIAGFAEAMRSRTFSVNTDNNNLLDTCGTGGDGAKTFNISTAAAIVSAAGGIRVAKHGNRAMSSKSGSADVLEALGVHIELDNEQAVKCIDEVGICFMFAQKYHQSMRHAAAPRREIEFRTVFNMLGPLTNPAGADRQLLGVYDYNKTELIASVLKELNLKRAMVVSSLDGLDEISISAPTKVTELRKGTLQTYEITPSLLGLDTHPIEALAGGDTEMNADIIRRIFAGEKGACRDVVLANSGACFYLAGLSESLQEGVKRAAEVIDSGKAMDKIQQLAQFTGGFSHVS